MSDTDAPKRPQRYEGDGFAVAFDPNVCAHSAVCIRSLPAVFDVKRKRWIEVEGAPADQIAATIARCPSGALRFEPTA
ncbi:MAG: (4Fe-4S)-binding protein [Gemmatimonadaceae bacterium]|nr:(4Fe-4S)-binding protein [Gemmatimonadaceae bacterium]